MCLEARLSQVKPRISLEKCVRNCPSSSVSLCQNTADVIPSIRLRVPARTSRGFRKRIQGASGGFQEKRGRWCMGNNEKYDGRRKILAAQNQKRDLKSSKMSAFKDSDFRFSMLLCILCTIQIYPIPSMLPSHERKTSINLYDEYTQCNRLTAAPFWNASLN